MCFRANCCREKDREEKGRKEAGREGWRIAGGKEGGREEDRKERRKSASSFRCYFYKQELLRSEILDLLILSGLDAK